MEGGERMIKKVLLPAVTLLVVGASIFGAHGALAADTDNPESTLVQKIATKFNLNQDEVQKVFDEEHASREAEMQTKNDERLSQLVTDGKITEAQKTLILNKQKELKASRSDKGSLKNLTPEERKSQMDAKKAELESWAKENGIDVQYLFGFGGHGFRGGPVNDK